MSEDAIESAEITMADAKKMVERRDKLLKLQSNREFRSLFLDGYLNEEPARLARLMGDSTHARRRDEISLDIMAIGKFDEFMRVMIAMGNQAEETIADHMEMVAQMELEANEVDA